jgi:hypothetical protein
VIVVYAVLTVVFLALLVGFVAFWRYSHTQAWSRSETRAAAMGFLITIAPFFGGRVQPPKPEIPVAMTPGPDQEDRLTGVTTERVIDPGDRG